MLAPCLLFLLWLGYFSGQTGYGYRSFEAFIDAVRQIEAGAAPAEVSEIIVRAFFFVVL